MAARRMCSLRGGSRGGKSERWKEYHITSTGSGATMHADTADGFRIVSDTPLASGGQNSAPQPVYLLLAALIGCKQATAKFVALKMRLDLGTMAFDLRAKRDERGALAMPIDDAPNVVSRLQHVAGTVTVETSASQEELDALARQVALRCPVANMCELSGCHVDLVWQRSQDVMGLGS